ncbi:MAG: C40 family peptidase [Bacteroidetes bacterium]|nr:C40 family peptidase [Bacteroidota bacterium]
MDKNTTENASSYAAKKLQNKYAAVLAVNPESIKNIKLYQFVDEWIGVPYKYGGKTKDGIDCSDFTSVLCKTVYNKTVEVPATKIYSACKPIPKEEIQEEDLVFFKIESEKISHVGVYLQNNKFIHASTKKGVIINDLNEAYYKKYFYKAARIK